MNLQRQSSSARILLLGNDYGIQSSLSVLPKEGVVGIVAPANRPSEVARVHELGKLHSIPVYVQPYRRHHNDYQAFLKLINGLSADVFVSNSYSMILDVAMLGIPPLGTINVHNGLLPEYRGANVINWALINGETETGVTIHYMNEGIDTGDVIAQRTLPIDFEDTAVTLRDKLFQLATQMLRDVMPAVITGTAERTPQDHSRARHWPRRRPEDGRIDWSKDALEIYHLIRALVLPWPGAFYSLPNAERVVIDKWMPLDEVRQLTAEMLSLLNPKGA